MKKNSNCRFTLTELINGMVTISILPAIALPIYRDYKIKSRITEAIFAGVAVNTATSKFYLSATTTVINSSLIIINAVFIKNKVYFKR